MRKIVPTDAVLVPDNAKRVFHSVLRDVYQWPQDQFDGSVATFEMLRRADTVLAVCIANDKIIITRETQPPREVFTGKEIER